MEECAELIQAINKCLRFPKDEVKRLNLIEEMADVFIMLLQLQAIYEIEETDLTRMIRFKIHRLYEKIEKNGI